MRQKRSLVLALHMRPPESGKTSGKLAIQIQVIRIGDGKLHLAGRQVLAPGELDDFRVDIGRQHGFRGLCQLLGPVAGAAGNLEHTMAA